MPNFAIPQQIRYNDPYQQRILDFNTQDSRVYISRSANLLLQAFGNDIVLSGFNITLEKTGFTAKVTVGPGFAIVDSTLIRSSGNCTVELDVSSYCDTNNGCHLIVFLSYQYINSVMENSARIELYHINNLNNVISPSGYDPSKCRIVLALIDFVKGANGIVSIGLSSSKSVVVNGKQYYVKGFHSSNIAFYDLIVEVVNMILEP